MSEQSIMFNTYTKKIVLENGTEYYGYGFGADVEKVNELVFNTSMVGYQEILSDPSYTDQSVVMTYPLIGNYGMAEDDYETKTPTIGGLIVREYNDEPSNFRSEKTLGEVMKKYSIPGIYGVDTRKITRFIRTLGSCKVLMANADTPIEKCMQLIKETEVSKNVVSRVSCKEKWTVKAENPKYNVALIDCGVKMNIVRSLTKRDCNVTIVPWNTKPEEILKLNPDGIVCSNGPGDPEEVTPVIETVRALKGKLPIMGICLGHQIISLAYGAKTYKLKFGHRGGNHPVMNLHTGKIEITSQNHSFAVDSESLKNTDLVATHINLLDKTIEGVECKNDKIFSIQYHPESAPGPQDSAYLFERFVKAIKEGKQ